MYDQEKIKKMKNHELAMEAYYYSINNKLIGGISEKNAVKCFEQTKSSIHYCKWKMLCSD